MHGNERPGDLFIDNWAHGQIVRIAKSQATVIGLAGHIAVERLFQRLSVTLQKFNASMILNSSPITA
jgi:hypothetical protein